ncbi:MAG: hypothetical protein AB1486_31925 [Planctomycetota bacterium]
MRLIMCVAALALLTAGTGAGAEGVIFSLTGQGSLPSFEGADKDLFRHVGGELSAPFVTSQGMAFLVGDLDSNGVCDDLTNIDGLDIVPQEFPSPRGFLLSVVSDMAGIKDGDIFRPSPNGGPEVVFAEDVLVSAIGATDGNIDVDALYLSPLDGSLLFSVAEDEASAFLSGSTPGYVGDDEILRLAAGAPAATILYDAQAVRATVGKALGVDPFDVKDVLSLTAGPDGAVWFTIQSPSEHDATVFSMRDGGIVVDGHRETDFGFLNGVEIDALAFVASLPEFLAVRTDPVRPSASDTPRIDLWCGSPGAPFQVLLSLSAADPSLHPLPGFGGLYLDPTSPLFAVVLRAAPFFGGWLDAEGRGQLVLPAPSIPDLIDIAIQVLDGSRLAISHPVWLEINQ